MRQRAAPSGLRIMPTHPVLAPPHSQGLRFLFLKIEHHSLTDVLCTMKRAQLVVPWQEGLHLRPAARLVQLAKSSKSAILLKVGAKIADARSILAVLLLCAVAGTVIDVEISGEDEDATLASVTRTFEDRPVE
jgi:phosphocarrier protein HPr